jgi:Ca2+-binding RTX toxin-like protein
MEQKLHNIDLTDKLSEAQSNNEEQENNVLSAEEPSLNGDTTDNIPDLIENSNLLELLAATDEEQTADKSESLTTITSFHSSPIELFEPTSGLEFFPSLSNFNAFHFGLTTLSSINFSNDTQPTENEYGFDRLDSKSNNLTDIFSPDLLYFLQNNEVSTPAKPTFSAIESEPVYAALDTITHSGSAINDTISGNNLSINIMTGFAGNDILIGGQLDDQLWGGDGDDTLTGGNGDDIIFGAGENDVVLGGDGDDLIWGGDGDDTLTGGNGDDFLSGNEGNDTLYGNSGSDIIYGGDGNDVIYTLDSSFSKSDSNEVNIVNAGPGNDTVHGSSGTDILHGDDGEDVINSHSGSGDSYEDYVLASNPLVYYRLGETSGSTAVDETGSINGTYATTNLGQDAFNASLENTSVYFNNQYMQVTDDPMFDTTQGTVSAWFKADNISDLHTVFAKDGNGDVDGQFYLGVDSNGDIFGRVQQDGTSSSFTFDPTNAIGGKVQTDQWYMLTMSYGAGGADFYINDQLLGSNATLTQTNSDGSFLIGARNSSAVPDAEFNGKIDEAVWFTTEYNSTSVGNLYSAGINATLDAQNITALYGDGGDDTLNGSVGIDRLSGGDGVDTLFGGGGSDTFIFEAVSAYNDIDIIDDFDKNEGDILDISDILSGYGVNAGNISDYIDINLSGEDTYYDYIMALDPILYFRLDETSGGIAADSAGNLDGSYLGSPQYAQSGFNNNVSNTAAVFDGSNDEIVEVVDNPLFNTTQGTVSAWFNVADMSSNGIVFAKDGNGDVDGQFYLGVDTNGDIFGRYQHSGTSDSITYDPTAALGGKVQIGQWYMLTMTYGAGGADVYIDGQLIGSNATLTSTNSDRSFLIGARNSSSAPDLEFDGSIDEVFWLGDELNATEVGNLYAAANSASDNAASTNGLYVDTTGTGSFNIGNLIATFTDLTAISDELTMFNNGNLIV